MGSRYRRVGISARFHRPHDRYSRRKPGAASRDFHHGAGWVRARARIWSDQGAFERTWTERILIMNDRSTRSNEALAARAQSPLFPFSFEAVSLSPRSRDPNKSPNGRTIRLLSWS